MQSFILLLVISISQGSLVAAMLHSKRMSYDLDYLLTLLFPWNVVKQGFIEAAWQPILGIAGFSVLHIVLFVLVSLLIWILAILFGNHIGFRQSFNYSVWGASHYLWLLPLGFVQFRLLSFDWYRTFILALFGVLAIIYLVRMLLIFRIGFRISGLASLGLFLLLLLIFAGASVSFYQAKYAFIENIQHYISVIRPWIQS